MEKKRSKEYQKNDRLDELLDHLNASLSAGEEERTSQLKKPRYPVLFVIGAPRSGTTLAMQWLASTKKFSYPTNLLSRFYAAPYTGSLIARMLLDPALQYRDEFQELHSSKSNFESYLGKTSGIREPNEFWYFWRRFFPVELPQPLSKEILSAADPAGFARGIAAIERVADLPFATKGMLLQYDLALLSSAFDSVVFLVTHRNFENNVESLQRVRKKLYGDEATWYSAQPPEFEELKTKSPLEQIVGQVEGTNRAIERQRKKIEQDESSKCLFVDCDYQEFCNDPNALYDQLKALFDKQGYELPSSHEGIEQFEPQNRELPSASVKQIGELRSKFIQEFGHDES